MRKINVTEKDCDLTWSFRASVGMVPQIRQRRPEGPNEWRLPSDIVTVMKRTSRLCNMVADTTQQGMIPTGRKLAARYNWLGCGGSASQCTYAAQHNTTSSVIVLAFTLMGGYAVG